MRPEGDSTDRAGGSAAAALVENLLVVAAVPALWLWFLRRLGYPSFQGWWVDAVLLAVLLVMLVIAVRRLSRWAGLGWRHGREGGDGRRHG